MRGKSLGDEQFAQNSNKEPLCENEESKNLIKYGAKQSELKGFLAAATILWMYFKKSSKEQNIIQPSAEQSGCQKFVLMESNVQILRKGKTM